MIVFQKLELGEEARVDSGKAGGADGGVAKNRDFQLGSGLGWKEQGVRDDGRGSWGITSIEDGRSSRQDVSSTARSHEN